MIPLVTYENILNKYVTVSVLRTEIVSSVKPCSYVTSAFTFFHQTSRMGSVAISDSVRTQHLCFQEWDRTIKEKHKWRRTLMPPLFLLGLDLKTIKTLQTLYRSGTVNSKSFIGKVSLWNKWKYELNMHFEHEMKGKYFTETSNKVELRINRVRSNRVRPVCSNFSYPGDKVFVVLTFWITCFKLITVCFATSSKIITFLWTRTL